MKNLLIIQILVSTITFSQTNLNQILFPSELNSFIEEISGKDENNSNIDYFENLLDNPININSVEEKKMEIFPFLTSSTIKQIIKQRKLSGEFISRLELLDIEGIDKNAIKILINFITIDKPSSKINPRNKIWHIKLRSRSGKYIQKSKGFLDGKYIGNDLKFYSRLKFSYADKLKVGGLVEKDSGENNFSDMNSFYLNFKRIGFINNAIIGDYVIEFGKGLAMWGPYKLSKGANVFSPIKRKDRNLIPYSSTNETLFLRGTAASFSLGNFIASAFYSSRKLDARLDSNNSIITFINDGFHRYSTEISNKKVVNEKLLGGRIDYSSNHLGLSFLYFNSTYSDNIKQRKIFGLHGSKFNYYSTAYNINFNSINFSGEFSYNSISVASINSIEFSLSKNLHFIVSYRNYPYNYLSLKGNAFSEATINQNESGFYMGVKFRNNLGHISLYYDQFRFPTSTINNPFPGNGQDFMCYWKKEFKKNLTLKLKINYETKNIYIINDGVNVNSKQIKRGLRIDLINNINKFLTYKIRGQYSYYTENVEKSTGYLFYNEIKASIFSNLYALARFSIFNTDDYKSRIYEWEHNLDGVISNPALFGDGYKINILFKYNIGTLFKLSIMYTSLVKPSETSLGSSYQTIYGNHKEYLSMQFEMLL